jgi:hypothetical protein
MTAMTNHLETRNLESRAVITARAGRRLETSIETLETGCGPHVLVSNQFQTEMNIPVVIILRNTMGIIIDPNTGT